MRLHDYDEMLDMIEANIQIEKDDLAELVKRSFVLDERASAEYFQIINENQRTLRQYIVERKVCHALADFASGVTLEKVSEKYNYELTSLRKAMITYDSQHRSPRKIREAGFECPEPVYLRQIVSEHADMIKEEQDAESNNRFLKELMALIDENTTLRDSLSQERRKARSLNIITEMNTFSKEKYNEFLELENLRVSYGFSVDAILALQNESEKTGTPLKELCNMKLDTLFFAEPSMDEYDEGYDEIERLEYHNTYELNTAEAWNLYYNDDGYENAEPDFYAENESDYYGNEDISDAEWEAYFAQADEEDDYEPDEIEPFIRSDEFA